MQNLIKNLSATYQKKSSLLVNLGACSGLSHERDGSAASSPGPTQNRLFVFFFFGGGGGAVLITTYLHFTLTG